jgi:hypothetical protein
MEIMKAMIKKSSGSEKEFYTNKLSGLEFASEVIISHMHIVYIDDNEEHSDGNIEDGKVLRQHKEILIIINYIICLSIKITRK